MKLTLETILTTIIGGAIGYVGNGLLFGMGWLLIIHFHPPVAFLATLGAIVGAGVGALVGLRILAVDRAFLIAGIPAMVIGCAMFVAFILQCFAIGPVLQYGDRGFMLTVGTWGAVIGTVIGIVLSVLLVNEVTSEEPQYLAPILG